MTNDTIYMIRLGREVITDGRLRALRERLKLSSNLMSELFYVSQITYARWEKRGGDMLKPSAAERIGRVYTQIIATLDQLERDNVKVDDLIPFHLTAAAAGIPNELLLSRYRAGEFEAVDLGILGLWVHREDLHLLGVDDK